MEILCLFLHANPRSIYLTSSPHQVISLAVSSLSSMEWIQCLLQNRFIYLITKLQCQPKGHLKIGRWSYLSNPKRSMKIFKYYIILLRKKIAFHLQIIRQHNILKPIIIFLWFIFFLFWRGYSLWENWVYQSPLPLSWH